MLAITAPHVIGFPIQSPASVRLQKDYQPCYLAYPHYPIKWALLDQETSESNSTSTGNSKPLSSTDGRSSTSGCGHSGDGGAGRASSDSGIAAAARVSRSAGRRASNSRGCGRAVAARDGAQKTADRRLAANSRITRLCSCSPVCNERVWTRGLLVDISNSLV